MHSRAPTRLLLLTKHGERTTRQRGQHPTVNLLAKMSQKKPFGTADSIRPICSDDDCELPRDGIDGLRHWDLNESEIMKINNIRMPFMRAELHNHKNTLSLKYYQFYNRIYFTSELCISLSFR